MKSCRRVDDENERSGTTHKKLKERTKIPSAPAVDDETEQAGKEHGYYDDYYFNRDYDVPVSEYDSVCSHKI